MLTRVQIKLHSIIVVWDNLQGSDEVSLGLNLFQNSYSFLGVAVGKKVKILSFFRPHKYGSTCLTPFSRNCTKPLHFTLLVIMRQHLLLIPADLLNRRGLLDGSKF